MGLEMEQLSAAGLLSLGAREDRSQLRPYKVMRNEQLSYLFKRMMGRLNNYGEYSTQCRKSAQRRQTDCSWDTS